MWKKSEHKTPHTVKLPILQDWDNLEYLIGKKVIQKKIDNLEKTENYEKSTLPRFKEVVRVNIKFGNHTIGTHK